MGTLLSNQSYQSQNRIAKRIERSLNWNPSQCPIELSKVMAWFDRDNFNLLSGDHLTEVPALANLIELRCMIRSNEEFTVHALSAPKKCVQRHKLRICKQEIEELTASFISRLGTTYC